MNLWGVVHVSKLKTRTGKTARRMLSYSETFFHDSAIGHQNVFWYDHATDMIVPRDTGAIIKNSKKIRHSRGHFNPIT